MDRAYGALGRAAMPNRFGASSCSVVRMMMIVLRLLSLPGLNGVFLQGEDIGGS